MRSRHRKTGGYIDLCLPNRVKCAFCSCNYYHAGNGKDKGFYRRDTRKDSHRKCKYANFTEGAAVDDQVWSKVLGAVRDPEEWADELEEAYVVHGTMSGESYAKLARLLRGKNERLRIRAYELRQSLDATEKQAVAR